MKNALRRRITPFVPFSMTVEDADGGKFEVHFKLAFDFNSYALFEEKTGLSVLTGGAFGKPSARNTLVLLWAAVQIYQPEYAGDTGLSAIGSMLSLDMAPAAVAAVEAAFLASLPKGRLEELEAAGGETPNVQSAK